MMAAPVAPVDPVAEALQALKATQEASAKLRADIVADLPPAERAAWARWKARCAAAKARKHHDQ